MHNDIVAPVRFSDVSDYSTGYGLEYTSASRSHDVTQPPQPQEVCLISGIRLVANPGPEGRAENAAAKLHESLYHDPA